MLALKSGLFYENGELIYYKDGTPKHAGVIRTDDGIYYISSGGKAVKGRHIVHREMSNGILKRGTYIFGEDYKLVKGSYVAPKKIKKQKTQNPVKIQRKENIQKKLKEMKHKKLIVGSLLAAVLLVGAVWAVERSINGETQPQPTVNEGVNAKVTLPQFDGDVVLCSKAAKQEYDGELALKLAVTTGDPYRPFVFEYSFINCSGTLLLGERQDFSDAIEYELPEEEKSISIHNLKVDTTYYYKVLVNDQTYSGFFHTAPSTRYVYIPGLRNTRDIGGGTTLDGKEVKQGLLIRGVELDGLGNVKFFIPNDKLEQVKQEFGFVYDMDLRAATLYSGTYSSRLGVGHKFYTAPQYGEIFNRSYHPALKQIFSDLAKSENYPMYLHCTWGRDRTGTIVFLLQGVLNMSQEDMVKEYRRSAYFYSDLADNENISVVIAGLESYKGETLQEKIITFLTTEIGVTEAEIASIREIFLRNAD